MLDQEPLYQQVHLHFQELGQIEALVLTSFGLDVRYLEERILPSFFPELGDGPASEPHRPLFEYLEETPVPISVMFDANNLVRGDHPIPPGGSVTKELRWQAHPINGRNRCFHPKLILALVRSKDDQLSLVVGCGSANLTQPGWGKNLEACILQSIQLAARGPNSLLADVLELLEDLRARATNSVALDQMLEAVTNAQPRAYGDRVHAWNYRTRLWHSGKAESLQKFLKEKILKRDLTDADYQWRLEVLSPYYGDSPNELLQWAHGEFATAGAVEPEILCCCPQIEGKFDISPDLAATYAASGKVRWAKLPDSLVKSKLRTATGEHLTRFLHAKIYRFWCADAELLVVGSANATAQGCRDGGQGNDEACVIFSREAPQGKPLKAWLTALDETPDDSTCVANPTPTEDRATQDVLPAFHASFDWATHQLELRNQSEIALVVTIGGGSQSPITVGPKIEKQRHLSGDAVGALFRSPTVRVSEGRHSDPKWLYLVEEINLHAKPPSPTLERSADQLIQDWQQGFDERLADKVARVEAIDQQAASTPEDDDWQDEVSGDRLNDIFLALWRFRKDVEALLGPDNEPDEFAKSRLRARVFGQGAMSVRYLMKRLREASEKADDEPSTNLDPVDLYICLLTIRDAIWALAAQLRASGFKSELPSLRGEIRRSIKEARKQVGALLRDESGPFPRNELLEWVEDNFRHTAATARAAR